MLLLLTALTLSLPKEAEFLPYHEEAGVKITLAKTATHPWVRGTGLVEAAAEKIAAVLKDLGRYHELFSGMIERSQVLKTEGASMRVHLVWPFPFFMRDRDAVVTYEVSPKPFVLTWKRSDEAGDPSKGIRIDRVEGKTELVPGLKGTQMTYTYFADLGGDFGDSVSEKAWKHEPVKYFEAIRSAMK